ncbi:MAG: helix-turn-helix transcriptional regulator [Alphaproteobacteria bacterium]|jgi:hypothetical protein
MLTSNAPTSRALPQPQNIDILDRFRGRLIVVEWQYLDKASSCSFGHELLTIAQVYKQYGAGRTSLYEALNRGALLAKVIDKRGTRLPRGDVDAWIENLPDYVRAAGN